MKDKEIELKYCCGCGLCGKDIPGDYDSRGYYRPEALSFPGSFDSSVCYCHQTIKKHNSLWGDFVGCYYGYSKDPAIRRRSSSGGVLTSVACYLLQSGKVDVVVQIGESQEDHLKTEVRYNTTEEEVISCSGSRYTASASLHGVLSNIDEHKKYAIIGKPCDIRVMRAYLNLHKELSESICYLLTFFCGGTPSIQANDNLIAKMGLKRNEISFFRYRGNGWPGKTMGQNMSGEIKEMEYEESWGKYLGRDLQEICRFCWEGVGEAADISCGDGWYLENGKPSFLERDGRNIIFARTLEGKAIIEQMADEGKIEVEEFHDFQTLSKMQPGQLMRKAAMFSRIAAMRVMGKTAPEYSLLEMVKYAKHIPLMLNIKMFGGTVKRIKNKTIQ